MNKVNEYVEKQINIKGGFLGFENKGFIYLLLSNIVFFITSYTIYFGLARIFPTSTFGDYGVVISLVSIFTVVLSDSIRQIISKFVSENPKIAGLVKRKALLIFFIFGFLVTFIFFAFSGFFSILLNDTSLEPTIRISSVLIILQVLFSVFVGFLNGLKNFKYQALIEISYYILKMAFILLFAFLGFGLDGVIFGFIIALALACILGFFITSSKFFVKQKFSSRQIISFGWVVLAFTIVVHLLNNIDLFFVKALSESSINSIFSGYYLAASTIARMPQIFVIALVAVLFPYISESISLKSQEQARIVFEKSLKCALIVFTFFIGFFIANSKELISLAYSEKFLPGVSAFEVLIFTAATYSIFLIFVTTLLAAKKPLIAFAISALILVIDFFATLLFFNHFDFSIIPIVLFASLFIGIVLAGFYLKKTINFSFPNYLILKLLVIGVIIFVISKILVFKNLLLGLDFIISVIIFVILSLFFGVFSEDDIKEVIGIFTKIQKS